VTPILVLVQEDRLELKLLQTQEQSRSLLGDVLDLIQTYHLDDEELVPLQPAVPLLLAFRDGLREALVKQGLL
jgi:hypothetical protein